MFGPRGCGRTTAIAEAAKKIGAMVVCVHHRHARLVRSEHGVETTSIDTVDRATMGMRTPVIWDHHAAEYLYLENNSLREVNKLLRDKLASCQAANRRLRKEALATATKKEKGEAMRTIRYFVEIVTSTRALGERAPKRTTREEYLTLAAARHAANGIIARIKPEGDDFERDLTRYRVSVVVEEHDVTQINSETLWERPDENVETPSDVLKE